MCPKGTELRSADVKSFAESVGFDIARITSAEPFTQYQKTVNTVTSVKVSAFKPRAGQAKRER